MDYEKKYKEAVKAIKELSDSFDDDNLTNELGIIFPELKESDLVPQTMQKPAEWSEEDEATKNNISHIIRQYDKISKRENQPCYYVGDCLLWMQNIKGRVLPQPKQEWSKEDFNNLKDAISLLAHPAAVCTESNDELRFKIIDWLKSLRPQSHWMPSEGQLGLLETILKMSDSHISLSEWEKIAFKNLVEHLKKLKD